LCFALVYLLSKLGNLIGALGGFLGELVHFLFQVFVNFSDFSVEGLFLLDQSFKIMLINELLFNVGFEICERLCLQSFIHELIHSKGEIFFDALDKLLVAGHIWVVLKLSTEYSGGILELLSNDLNLVFGLLKLLLLRNSCELTSLHDKLCIFLL